MRKLAAFWLKFLVFLCLLAIAVNATGTLLSGEMMSRRARPLLTTCQPKAWMCSGWVHRI